MDEEEKLTATEGQEEEVDTPESETAEELRIFEEEEEKQEEAPVQEKNPVDVKKIEESIQEVKREQRISDFLNDPKNTDYKEFGNKIRELAKKPEAKGLTVEAIAKMVVPPDYWIKKGAELAKKAEQESVQSFTGGGSIRKVGEVGQSSELPDPSKMSREEFEKMAWDIARGVRP